MRRRNHRGHYFKILVKTLPSKIHPFNTMLAQHEKVMSWVLLKKIYQELDLDFLQLKGWFGTYFVKVCCNKILNYLSKLIPGRNEAYKQKNVVEIYILNSERHLLRFFFYLVSLKGIMLILLFKALDFNRFFSSILRSSIAPYLVVIFRAT